jgi:hypothetical protein
LKEFVMLFLLALPVISCVALFWRYLQIYAPSNILVRRVRSAPPHWRTVLVLLALWAALAVAMHVVTQTIERGAPGWLNLVVLVFAWDAIKVGWLAATVLLSCLARVQKFMEGGRFLL